MRIGTRSSPRRFVLAVVAATLIFSARLAADDERGPDDDNDHSSKPLIVAAKVDVANRTIQLYGYNFGRTPAVWMDETVSACREREPRRHLSPGAPAGRSRRWRLPRAGCAQPQIERGRSTISTCRSATAAATASLDLRVRQGPQGSGGTAGSARRSGRAWSNGRDRSGGTSGCDGRGWSSGSGWSGRVRQDRRVPRGDGCNGCNGRLAMGPIGPMGVQGPQGATGPQGPQGPAGLTSGAHVNTAMPSNGVTSGLTFLAPTVNVTITAGQSILVTSQRAFGTNGNAATGLALAICYSTGGGAPVQSGVGVLGLRLPAEHARELPDELRF